MFVPNFLCNIACKNSKRSHSSEKTHNSVNKYKNIVTSLLSVFEMYLYRQKEILYETSLKLTEQRDI